MSDTWVKVFPSDPWYQPVPGAAKAAESYVAGLFASEGSSVDVVEAEYHHRVFLVDAGANTQSVTCSGCGWALGPDFLEHLTTTYPDGFLSLDVQTPCCGAVMPVTRHRYDWPVGFARFEIGARNPVRDTPWLTEDELVEVGRLVGHPVFQVLAHY